MPDRPFHALKAIALVIGHLACVGAASAQTQDPPPGSGWVRKSFDFGMPELDFETVVPVAATAQTVPMAAAEPGTIGRVKIVGKVTSDKGGPPVEVTVMAYDMRSPAAALRICSFEAESAGYTPRSSMASPDLTEAKVFATKSDNGRPQGAILSHCFSRQDKALAIHFIAEIDKEKSAQSMEAAANAVIENLDDYATTFIDKLSFADGRKASFGDDLLSVPLRMGDRTFDVQVPAGWQIPINDFRGPLPAELHMLRRSDGKDVGLVWLSVQEMQEKPDLEKTGAAIIRNYFLKQSPDAEAPVMLVSGEDKALIARGLANREFRFSVRNKQGNDIGIIEAQAVWREGRLYVIANWSIWADAADRNTFFSRLPGMTAYDLVSAAVLADPQ